MDDETKKAIEGILGDWEDSLAFNEPCLCAIQTIWIDQISGRRATASEAFALDAGKPSPEGTVFEQHIYHTEDCPYTRLAKLVGRDGHHHYRR